jgi:hypothetical protein
LAPGHKKKPTPPPHLGGSAVRALALVHRQVCSLQPASAALQLGSLAGRAARSRPGAGRESGRAEAEGGGAAAKQCRLCLLLVLVWVWNTHGKTHIKWLYLYIYVYMYVTCMYMPNDATVPHRPGLIRHTVMNMFAHQHIKIRISSAKQPFSLFTYIPLACSHVATNQWLKFNVRFGAASWCQL